MSFLSSVAKYYIDNQTGSDWNRLHFVFPSHRAGVFFKNALQSQLGDRVIVGLRIMTIDDFFNSHSELKTADDLTLTFELFRVYQKVFADIIPDVADFTFFYSWASSFLSDFDDIDKYMVDAHQVFTNLVDYDELSDDYAHLSAEQRQAIERFWNKTVFKPGDSNVYKNQFVSVYGRLDDLYTDFRNALKAKGLAYKGMIVREVAEKFRNLQAETGDARYIFVGFNALTEAEKTVFSFLSKAQKADFFWDYSPLMLTSDGSSDDHGPGRFIRSCLKDFPMPQNYEEPLSDDFTNKNISVTHFAYKQGQIAKIADLFGKTDGAFASQNADNERTAIVLTDESMLIPAVAAIPSSVEHINVTMGYPLKHSPVFTLVDAISRLHDAGIINVIAGDVTFYHKAVVAVLQHPIFTSVCKSAYSTVDDIVSKNYIRVSRQQLSADGFMSLIFKPITDNDIVGYLNPILEYIYNESVTSKSSDDFHRECVYHCIKVLNRFGDILNSLDDAIAASVKSNNELIFKMLVDILENQSVDFKGMPLRGLQVMGILETRALDFDNILILDMNEGVFPKTSTPSTLIPYVLRKSFGLPTYEFQDSMYAYYFYRLIHRAKNIEMVYSDADNNGISRFVLQLKYQHKCPIKELVGVHKMQNDNLVGPSEIDKDEQIVDRMKVLFGEQKYISPTKIIHYIQCPISFYYRDVLRLDSSDDEVFEELDNRRFGKVFHYVMECLYEPGVDYTKEKIDAISNDDERINSLIMKAFAAELFPNENYDLKFEDLEARNILYFYAVVEYVKRTLEHEPVPFTFKKAEEEFKFKHVLSNGREINIGGVIDRQDICDGLLRVIDYKTGADNDFDIAGIDELFNPSKLDKKKAVFQIIMYCYLVDKVYNTSQTMPVVYKIVSSNKRSEIVYGLTIKKSNIVYSDIKDEFEDNLHALLDEIFDRNRPFSPVDDQKKCVDCQFAHLCFRSNSAINE